jgi:hypothetical protein
MMNSICVAERVVFVDLVAELLRELEGRTGNEGQRPTRHAPLRMCAESRLKLLFKGHILLSYACKPLANHLR